MLCEIMLGAYRIVKKCKRISIFDIKKCQRHFFISKKIPLEKTLLNIVFN